VTITPTSAPNSLTAKASTGVGSGRGNTETLNPAPLKISALIFSKISEPWRASRPMTTEVSERSFMNLTSPAAVRPTTA